MLVSASMTGGDQVKKSLQGISRDFKGDWSGPLGKVGAYLSDRFYYNFDKEGAIIGVRWPGGPYYHKLQGTPPRMKKAWERIVSPEQVLIRNTMEYAIFHQLGTKNLPKRPIIGLTPELSTGIVKILQEAVKDILQRRT